MDYYRLILALHIISIICWMAGILYLYRLFIYHTEETEQVVKSRFHIMETRLYKYITMPAMLASILFGGWMIVLQPGLLSQHWLHAKLTLVFFLIGSTHMGKMYIRKLNDGTCKVSSKTFRFLNEVPTILMIGIVLLVILRPF